MDLPGPRQGPSRTVGVLWLMRDLHLTTEGVKALGTPDSAQRQHQTHIRRFSGTRQSRFELKGGER